MVLHSIAEKRQGKLDGRVGRVSARGVFRAAHVVRAE